jgi:hypothetical protein
VTDLSADWWGRPAYQVRLRSKVSADGKPIFLYGGGLDPEGEYERSGDGEWLAGFSSAPGGTSPGVGAPYPDNGWKLGDFSPVSTGYQRYRFIVKPNLQELWVNVADDGVTWVKVGDMPIPFEADAPPGAPLYRYFEQLEGLRIYFRSPGTGANASNVYLDYLTLKVEDLPVETSFAAWAADKPLPEGEQGPLDDPFGQGITNLERYAMLYPVDSVPASDLLPRLDGSAAAPVYHFRRPAGGRPDVDYTVWMSGDLMSGAWSMVDSPTYWDILPDGEDEIVTVATDKLPTGMELFLKLVVSLKNGPP